MLSRAPQNLVDWRRLRRGLTVQNIRNGSVEETADKINKWQFENENRKKKNKTTKIRIETNCFALLETNVCNQRMPAMEMERAKPVSFLVQKDFRMEMHVAEETVAQEKTWKVRC
jgi:hypothetical protein